MVGTTSTRNPFTGPCHCDREASQGDEPAACGSKDYVSAEEVTVLGEMRVLQARGRALRAELLECPAGSPRHQELAAMLEAAREEFQRCRAAWTEANELKLRRLGHLP